VQRDDIAGGFNGRAGLGHRKAPDEKSVSIQRVIARILLTPKQKRLSNIDYPFQNHE
jgi:hypothetical protein